VGGLAVLDGPTRREGQVRLAEIVARLRAHLDETPRLRQRVTVPWGGLARPLWASAPAFRLDDHVERTDVPDPGGRRQLEDTVATLVAGPLDRDRPLWRLWLLDGLEDGGQAVLIKVHHAVADGIGTMALAEALFDRDDTAPAPATPDPAAPSTRPVPGAAPGGMELFASALARQLAAPWRELYDTSRRAVADPPGAYRRATRTAAGIWQLARAGSTPPTALNHAVGPDRQVTFFDVPRARIKAARRAGASDNDVILAAVAAALHARLGPHAPARVRTVLPVSTRSRRQGQPGSWTATLTVDLPIGPMTPADRLAAVERAAARAKRSDQVRGSQVVMDAIGTLAPPFLHARFARFAYRGNWFNLIVSTLPGPRGPRYLAGSRVAAAYPIIPLAEDVGVTVGALRWNDRVTIGLNADPSQVDGLDELAADMVAFIDELASPPPVTPGDAEPTTRARPRAGPPPPPEPVRRRPARGAGPRRAAPPR
jgi:WS/DGAT/MGAT family acyltransferase